MDSTSKNENNSPPRKDLKKDKSPREPLRSLMARKRHELQVAEAYSGEIFDPYENSMLAETLVRGKTGLAYNLECLKHKCDWDDNYPECPDRLAASIKRCRQLGLEERCLRVSTNRQDIYDKVITKHSKELYNKLKSVSGYSMEQCEEESSKYDAVYFNQHTFQAACESLECVLNVVADVAKGNLQNGMAITRPPGHHAMENEYCGYCFFNNVAIAAEMCINEHLAKRVLIVDYDVHHGQATQQMFYDRNDVLYFSIHRYEYGTFWPNLIESNFNCIGNGAGLGYNINVPLNDVGLKDDDYLAIVFNILLPVAYEFNPDLIIVSAGYDAAIGCPEGQMKITPGFYSHLITLLSGLAQGKLAVCLEGGYFRPSLAEGVAMTLKALLGDPCPRLEPLRNVHPSVIETICNVRSILLRFWTCFGVCSIGSDGQDYIIKYFGQPLTPPYQTRNCYPIVSHNEQIYNKRVIDALAEKYNTVAHPVCYVYDDRMVKHKFESSRERPERPQRLLTTFDTFMQFGLAERCCRLLVKLRDYSKYHVHDEKYLAKLKALNLEESNDVYFNESTNSAIDTAVSGLLTVVDNVMRNNATSGLAIIRPPGHHAEFDKAGGFCFVNNVAIAANYLREFYNLERILIIDFDVHHGNGTQKLFYDSKNIMYLSVHRYDDGKFFPASDEADFTYDGCGCGQGFNVNIPLSHDRMGDTDYLAIFHNLILPIAYSFDPQVVLVSAGYDAGINDPLGCYYVSPETFGHIIQLLKPLAEGKLILSLEGGYNVTTLSLSVAMCTKVLLGDPIPMPNNLYKILSKRACETIINVSNHFEKYWPLLGVNRTLSLTPYISTKRNNGKPELIDQEHADNSEYIETLINIHN